MNYSISDVMGLTKHYASLLDTRHDDEIHTTLLDFERALFQLDKPYLFAVYAYAICGLTLRQIHNGFGMPRETTRRLYKEAVVKLQEFMNNGES